jgi:hypothetical protein
VRVERQLPHQICIGAVTVIAALGILSLTAGAPLAATKDKCGHEQDPEDFQECFITRFPCAAMYFGVDGPIDYAGALKCFEADKSWPFVVLMYLNGEGTPRDLIASIVGVFGSVSRWRGMGKEWLDEYGWVIDDYQKTAQESQLHWSRFRDLFAELAGALYSHQKTFDPALSMKAAMTKIRIAELHNDPFGPPN